MHHWFNHLNVVEPALYLVAARLSRAYIFSNVMASNLPVTYQDTILNNLDYCRRSRHIQILVEELRQISSTSADWLPINIKPWMNFSGPDSPFSGRGTIDIVKVVHSNTSQQNGITSAFDLLLPLKYDEISPEAVAGTIAHEVLRNICSIHSSDYFDNNIIVAFKYTLANNGRFARREQTRDTHLNGLPYLLS